MTLDDTPPPSPPEAIPGVTLRAHQIGDIGWIVHRQAVLYAQEYGWDISYEALIAEIAAKFLREFKPEREHCWVALHQGHIVGSVFLVEDSEHVARLRLLYVEPFARGLGLGRLLTQTCIDHARSLGYQRLVLWTNAVLTAARHIYESCGFVLVQQKSGVAFGHPQVSQDWSLTL